MFWSLKCLRIHPEPTCPYYNDTSYLHISHVGYGAGGVGVLPGGGMLTNTILTI